MERTAVQRANGWMRIRTVETIFNQKLNNYIK